MRFGWELAVEGERGGGGNWRGVMGKGGVVRKLNSEAQRSTRSAINAGEAERK